MLMQLNSNIYNLPRDAILFQHLEFNNIIRYSCIVLKLGFYGRYPKPLRLCGFA
jgi:hypothetical protein